MSIAYTIGIGPVKLTFTHEELMSLKNRFKRSPIYGGPCMILNRANGLALDATPTASYGTHNLLWNAHAGLHQQWRLRDFKDGTVEIASEVRRLRLTTMAHPSDWGEVWLENKDKPDWSTRWRLRESEDRVAFVIESLDGYALDAGRESTKNSDPHVWRTTWDPWQQWVIVRLPLT